MVGPSICSIQASSQFASWCNGRRSRCMSELTAYHEAGHAFVAIHVGATVRSVTVTPDWDDGPQRFGDTQVEWPQGKFTPRELQMNAILVALAGPVAEMIHRGEPYHPGFVAEWAADWQEAWKVATSLFPVQRVRLAFLEKMTTQLYQLLSRDDHWAALAAIVDNLAAHETLEGDVVEEIISSWMG